MKMTRIRCTNCGAEFENVTEGQTLFRCTRQGCGCVFLVEQGQQFLNVEKFEAQKIAGLRTGMAESLKNRNYEQLSIYAGAILEMMPGDFRAGAALALCGLATGQSGSLLQFLKNPPACTEEDYLELFPYLLEKGGYREACALEETLENCVLPENRKKCEQEIKRRKKELRMESDLYADVPRDVFICHSSTDSQTAEELVRVLEKDGNQCWISSRNLPPDTSDYWKAIEKAIFRCRIFLVVCSEAAMLSPDVQRELTIAEKSGAARLEVKLDRTEHTTQFHYFFDGINWIDATGNPSRAFKQVKARVFECKREAEGYGETAKISTKKAEKDNQKNAANMDQRDTENTGRKSAENKDQGSSNYRSREYARKAKTRNTQGTPGKLNVALLVFLEAIVLLLLFQDDTEFWNYLIYRQEGGILIKGASCFVAVYVFLAAADIYLLWEAKHIGMALLTALPGLLLFADVFLFNRLTAGNGTTSVWFYTYDVMCDRLIVVLCLIGFMILADLWIALNKKGFLS